MNKKVLFDFGKGVLVVVVGLLMYDTLKPMISKAKLSDPTTK